VSLVARLRPTSDATTVQVRDGKVLISDGPFAETKEQIGGYCLIDCKDLDEAIEVASQIPGARTGTIEVRPIWGYFDELIAHGPDPLRLRSMFGVSADTAIRYANAANEMLSTDLDDALTPGSETSLQLPNSRH
jgi:hypothetical protein